MQFTNDQIIEFVLRFEGGFVDNPADRGGPTNFGITAASLGRWRKLGRSATRDEVHAMTRAEAVEIYESDYISAPKFNSITDSALRFAVVDSGVLHGPARAIVWLGQCLKVPATSNIVSALEDNLIEDVNAYNDPKRLRISFLSIRLKFLTMITTRDRSQLVFLAGWVNRVAYVLDEVA